jgi:DNA-binding GntR family transcriptional regulator
MADDAAVHILQPAPLRAVSLTAQAYDRLRRAITEDALAADSPLVIAQLVRGFGISHTPVREALARLHSEGLVSFVENVGYRVAARPSASDMRHWMEARLPLEVACVRLAATRITADEIEALTAVNARIRDGALSSDFDGVRRFAELNASFHRLLVTASRNPFLQRAHDQVWLGAHFSRVRFRRASDHAQISAEHAAIVAALSHGDEAAAARAMERHIIDSLERDSGASPPQAEARPAPRSRRRAVPGARP